MASASPSKSLGSPSKSLASLPSFKSLASVPGETPEERYRRLEAKYGRELHEAMARKDKLKQNRKVKSWMEVFVLLSEMEPRPVNKPPQIRTPNGQLDPVLAAGIVTDPMEEALLRKAVAPSASARLRMAKDKKFKVTKEDRTKVAAWLKEAVEAEHARLAELSNLPQPDQTQIDEAKQTIAELKEQIIELENLENIAEGKELTLSFNNESFIEKRKKNEALVALAVAFLAFVVMLILYVIS